MVHIRNIDFLFISHLPVLLLQTYRWNSLFYRLVLEQGTYGTKSVMI